MVAHFASLTAISAIDYPSATSPMVAGCNPRVIRLGNKPRAARGAKTKTPQLRIRADRALLRSIEDHAERYGMTTNSYIISTIVRDMNHGPDLDIRFLQDAIGGLARLVK